MTTGTDLVETVIRDINSGRTDELNEINGAYSAGATQITLRHELGGIAQGSLLGIGTELVYVWSIDNSGPSVTVRRGMRGTTAQSISDNDIVYVNPVVAPFDAFTAINSEIDALAAAGLYQMKSVDLTSSSTRQTYDLTSVANLLDVYEVRIDVTGPENTWPEIQNWSLARNMPTADFASGFMLRIDEAVDPSRTIRVRYKAPFSRLAALSDNVETVSGLTTAQLDIIEFGAQARLIAKREPRRILIDDQPDPRRSTEVTAGQTARAAQVLLALRDRRIAEEKRRLGQLYPARTNR